MEQQNNRGYLQERRRRWIMTMIFDERKHLFVVYLYLDVQSKCDVKRTSRRERENDRVLRKFLF